MAIVNAVISLLFVAVSAMFLLLLQVGDAAEVAIFETGDVTWSYDDTTGVLFACPSVCNKFSKLEFGVNKMQEVDPANVGTVALQTRNTGTERATVTAVCTQAGGSCDTTAVAKELTFTFPLADANGGGVAATASLVWKLSFIDVATVKFEAGTLKMDFEVMWPSISATNRLNIETTVVGSIPSSLSDVLDSGAGFRTSLPDYDSLVTVTEDDSGNVERIVVDALFFLNITMINTYNYIDGTGTAQTGEVKVSEDTSAETTKVTFGFPPVGRSGDKITMDPGLEVHNGQLIGGFTFKTFLIIACVGLAVIIALITLCCCKCCHCCCFRDDKVAPV